MSWAIRSAIMAALISVALATSAVAAPFTYPHPLRHGIPSTEPPQVSAASWILYDETNDVVLASWDADTRRPMASITKIMTVMVALEQASPTDLVTISEEAAKTGAQEIGLVAGETVTLGSLLRAALIRSGNDAAAAIAEHIGGSIDGFVAMMNQRAEELGMTNTHFVNPHGLDVGGHYSSARDMLIVGRQAMSMPEFAKIARARVLVFPDTPGGTARSATNTNRIINSYEGVIGVKTGETPNAGLTYVGAVERDGRRLFVVVFGSRGERAHFVDAIALYDWAFKDLGILGPIATGNSYTAAAPRVQPSPLIVEAGLEAFVHASAQGLASSPPSPPGEEEVPGPVAGTEVARHPEPTPSLLETLGYWLLMTIGRADG
jgi:D-alanyl-D-alanine carboxypeptidase